MSQPPKMSRTNEERTAATRAALIAAGRSAFLTLGFAGAGAPDICAEAGVTRGALRHHFGDKRGLFEAVVEAEAAAVAAAIRQSGAGQGTVLADLIVGGQAFLDAMAEPGRVQLMLVEAPVVLGPDQREAIEARHGLRTLRGGLFALAAERGADLGLVPPLAELLSAAYDHAALLIARGSAREPLERALERLLSAALPPETKEMARP